MTMWFHDGQHDPDFRTEMQYAQPTTATCNCSAGALKRQRDRANVGDSDAAGFQDCAEGSHVGRAHSGF